MLPRGAADLAYGVALEVRHPDTGAIKKNAVRFVLSRQATPVSAIPGVQPHHPVLVGGGYPNVGPVIGDTKWTLANAERAFHHAAAGAGCGDRIVKNVSHPHLDAVVSEVS